MNIIQSFLNVIKDKKNQEIVAGVTDTLTVLPITSTALKIQEKYEETKKLKTIEIIKLFLLEFDNISIEERSDFLSKLENDESKEKIIEALQETLNTLDVEQKSKITASCFKYYLKSEIENYAILDILYILPRIKMIYLHIFRHSKENLENMNEVVQEALVYNELLKRKFEISNSYINPNESRMNVKVNYSVTHIGKIVIRAVEENFPQPQS
jgi:hypothetical protein